VCFWVLKHLDRLQGKFLQAFLAPPTSDARRKKGYIRDACVQFYSVSSDGRVLLWSLSKSELTPELGMMLRLSGGDDEDAQASSLAGGCCFDFNPVSSHILADYKQRFHRHHCIHSGMFSLAWLYLPFVLAPSNVDARVHSFLATHDLL
jgi:hypothetical protein